MKILGFMTLLGLAAACANAGEGRVLFVCGTDTATCELAAQRFETQSRVKGWHLAGRAARLDDLTEADLALAFIVVTIDAPLFRGWLPSIERYEAWNDIPPAQRDREAAIDELDARIAALMR